MLFLGIYYAATSNINIDKRVEKILGSWVVKIWVVIGVWSGLIFASYKGQERSYSIGPMCSIRACPWRPVRMC